MDVKIETKGAEEEEIAITTKTDIEDQKVKISSGPSSRVLASLSASESDDEDIKSNISSDIDNNNDDKKTEKTGQEDEIIDFMRGYTILEDDIFMPYKNNCWSKFKYYLKSIVVMNPRLFSLWLLYKSIWPRLLVILDMYTDIIICIQLYKRNQIALFSLSLLFLSFPFIMVWITSLRFIQKYINDKNNTNLKNNKKFLKIINIFLIFYLFPPFGGIIVTIYEIFWVFYDVYNGFYSFIKGKILIIDKNQQTSSIKQFRRVIEFFGESIPQTIIQVYIFYALNNNSKNKIVNAEDLYLSLVVSIFNLIYNLIKLKQEAKFHCMTLSMYALSVLQLGMFFSVFFNYPCTTFLKKKKIKK